MFNRTEYGLHHVEMLKNLFAVNVTKGIKWTTRKNIQTGKST